MSVVVKSIGLISGLNYASQAVHRHVHQAELRVVLDLFLSIKSHRFVGRHALAINEIS